MSGVLSLNCGSSSVKYALFEDEDVVLRGAIDRVGTGGAPDLAAAVHAIFDELTKQGVGAPRAVGHRLVHGGPDHVEPQRVDAPLLASLALAVRFAPLHLPSEILAIQGVRARFADLPQVVCFDTAFHRALPEVARRYALPAALFDGGVRRYGFHGLSYEYVVESIGPSILRRAVLAHLGSGASMVAVRDGKAIDTTMGFTPSAGLVMGTRPGDVDPGLMIYLLEYGGYDASRLERLVNREAGLLALSGTTPDMRELLARRGTDERAALAVDVFCYQACKWIGALAAALGGMDALVFTGGIGEHASEVRREICRRLGHLGVALDDARNAAGERIISRDEAPCHVHVIGTDEERMIARHTRRVLSG
jgi:acetate kinase